MTQSTAQVTVQRFGAQSRADPCDHLAVEEPLEIRLEYGSADARLRNVVRLSLHPTAEVALERLERHFYTTSSCDVCGKTSIEALQLGACPVLPTAGPLFPAATISSPPSARPPAWPSNSPLPTSLP